MWEKIGNISAEKCGKVVLRNCAGDKFRTHETPSFFLSSFCGSRFPFSPLVFQALTKHRPGFGFGALCVLVMCMNMRFMAYKLQSALSQRGEHYKINQLQSYSVRHDRMVTKYVVEKIVPGQPRGERVLETYSMADVVKTLAKIYSG